MLFEKWHMSKCKLNSILEFFMFFFSLYFRLPLPEERWRKVKEGGNEGDGKYKEKKKTKISR